MVASSPADGTAPLLRTALSASDAARQPAVAVLGGGLSGLSAAWHLQRAGIRAVVLELSLRVGGAIGGTRSGDWFHEGGPNSLFETSAEIATFIDDLGLRSRALYAPEAAKKRYIVRGGRPVALPGSPLGFVSNRLLSWPAKLRILGEPFRRRSSPETEETVQAFVQRRLGPEFLDYVVNPFVAGVYAGDPQRLSVRHAFPKLHALEQEHGSLIRGAIKRRNPSGAPRGRMLSFPNGLDEIPAALASTLSENLRLGCDVTSVRPLPQSGISLGYTQNGSRREDRFDAVISTLPAPALSRIHFDGQPALAAARVIGELQHPPVVSVFTGFLRSDVDHPLDGFGLLVPEVEHRQILGTLFSSTLFPGRAPHGHVALTTFVGGMRQPELASLSDDELVERVHQELRALLGLRGRAVYVHLRRWPLAIPQYNLGFQRLKDAYQTLETTLPGFFVGGNCRDGISLSNCIDGGRRLAERVRATLAPTSGK